MKRSFSTRRSSIAADRDRDRDRDRGSVKRLKSFSTRDISWREQQALGGAFKSVGKGNWPARGIIGERGAGPKKQYLIEWAPHPETLEEFEPTWTPAGDVGNETKSEWQQKNKQDKDTKSHQEEKAAARRARLRRIIPESSADDFDHIEQESDAPQTPPSLLSDSSVSGPEISETQYPSERFTLNLPPLPQDKSDYETVQSSQPTLSAAHLEPGSPDTHISVTSSQSRYTQNEAYTPVVRQSPRLSSALNTQALPPHSYNSRTSRLSQQATSSKQKSLPKSVQFVQPASSSTANRQLPSSIEFITQLPFTNGSILDYKRPSQSSIASSSTRRSHRLASPFQDTPYTQVPSTPYYTSSQSSSASNPSARRNHSTGKSPATKPNPIRRVQLPLNNASPNRKLNSGLITSKDQPVGLVSVALPPNMASQRPDTSMLDPASAHVKSPLVNSISQDDIPAEGSLFDDTNQGIVVVAADPNSTTIHESIEEEPQSSETSHIMDSKANSSQESLNNEREIETVDGVMIPARPIFGQYEYAIALPAEGKVKSAYDEIIKVKRKAILRFISRKGSPGHSEISSKKTSERNEMQEMLQRLNNTTTHTDLGLSGTQYSLSSQENAAYADYAGSKFTMLGCLIDAMKIKTWSFAIFAQEGSLLELLEEYISMKHVTVRRHDRPKSDQDAEMPEGLSVDLMPTQSDKSLSLPQKPAFIIAFDASFASTDLQVRNLRQQYGEDLPILHFLVTNSSEHVERCVPVSLTSNIRLKVVVRTTYLASPNLGGEITLVAEPSDQPGDRPMDMGDIQRAVRKSPARRMAYIADIIASWSFSESLNENWSLSWGEMPELKLGHLQTPTKPSRGASRTPQPRGTRTHTPVSRATTPVGRKRLLDVEGENGSKRQRFTPVRDTVPESQRTSVMSDELHEARKHIAQLTTELTTVRNALREAEEKQVAADAKTQEWKDSHAELLRRYEAGRTKQKELHKENKKLTTTATSMTERDETMRTEKANLRQQIADLKTDLGRARDDLKAEGGGIAQVEEAREEARNATTKMIVLEKSLKSTKEDFEFTRSQYQDASKQAADLASEVKDLESQVEKLKFAAEDSKRSLKAMNYEQSLKALMSKAEQFQLEVKNREAFIRKLLEENASLKSRRGGVQTRGSSVQPASSPGPRSRQASPAPGHLMPPSGSRASVLRNER